MDMGGAGVVAGVMQTLALRKAKANVVGLVGLVENMPDGRAQRPGRHRASMKGDTVEIINTDAEGRLVLADVLWYAQERFEPSGDDRPRHADRRHHRRARPREGRRLRQRRRAGRGFLAAADGRGRGRLAACRWRPPTTS